MKGFIKNIASLLIALAILMGILFLPDANLKIIQNTLSYLGQSEDAAVSFGFYLVQKVITGALLLLVSFLLTISIYRAYLKEKGD